MQYYHKYKKENFPLAEFYLEFIPFAMLPLISFIFERTDYTVGGGAACNIILRNHGKLKDLDIFVHKDFKIFLQPFLDLRSEPVFWDTNFFCQDKCAIFFKENNLFHKIELTFCDPLLPAMNYEIDMWGKQFKIRVATPDWLFFAKLEKIGRKRLEPLPIEKFKNHVDSCIALAKILVCSLSSFVPSDEHTALARSAIKNVEKCVNSSFARELSHVLVQLGLIDARK